MNCDCPFCCWVRQVYSIEKSLFLFLCLRSPKAKCGGGFLFLMQTICLFGWGWSSLVSVGVSSYFPVQLRVFSYESESETILVWMLRSKSSLCKVTDFCSLLIWFHLKDRLGMVTGGESWGPDWWKKFAFPGQLSFCSSPSIFNAVFMIQPVQCWGKCQTHVYRQPHLLCLFSSVCCP